MARGNKKQTEEQTQQPTQQQTPPTVVEDPHPEPVKKNGRKKQTETPVVETKPVHGVETKSVPVVETKPVSPVVEKTKQKKQKQVKPVEEVNHQPEEVNHQHEEADNSGKEPVVKQTNEFSSLTLSELFEKQKAIVTESVRLNSELKTRIKLLEKVNLKNQKTLEKRKNKRNRKEVDEDNQTPKNNSGLTSSVPVPIANELADFLGLEHNSLYPRKLAIKAIIKYIKDHNLETPENKKFFIPDATLTKILTGYKSGDKLSYFGYLKNLKHLFPKVSTA